MNTNETEPIDKAVQETTDTTATELFSKLPFLMDTDMQREKRKANDKAANLKNPGDLRNVYSLAKRYALGLQEPESVEEEFLVLTQAEPENDPDVLCALGKAYEFGYGVEKSSFKAIEYYVKAADFGLFEAIEWLKEYKRPYYDCWMNAAFEHFKELADAGNVIAEFNIAYWFYWVLGGEENWRIAVSILESVKDDKYGNATTLLGGLYEFGHGIKEDERKALELYEQAAELSNRSGQYRLALTCYSKDKLQENNKEAILWFEKAAAQGHAKAAKWLTNYYTTGATKDEAKAFEYLKQFAISGDVDAECNVGSCYFIGVTVPTDYEKAVYWYSKAAAQNDEDALLMVGLSVELKDSIAGCEKNTLELHKLAAEQGSVIEQYNLALYYYTAEGVYKDYEYAVQWFKQAASEGYAKAINALGVYYSSEENVLKCGAEAFDMFERAAEKQDLLGQYNLGLCYANGIGTTQNYEKAVCWFEKAAELENVHIMKIWNFCYKYGCGVAKDFGKAFYYEEQTAKMGCAIEQYNLGLCYLNGEGVEINYEQAVLWFEKAAAENNANAEVELAYCYENGLGVAKDIVMGAELYNEAAEAGNVKAQRLLAERELCYRWPGENESEVVETLECAANNEDYDAMFKLAVCYESGIGTGKNFYKAVKLYFKLAEHGQKKATDRLIAMYENGLLGDEYSEEAIETFILGWNNGNINAMCELARCCLECSANNELTEEITENELFKTKVNELAKKYALGLAEPNSDEEAFFVFKEVENQNDPNVLCAIGRAYEFGWGTTKNVAKAIEYYAKAAETGSYESMERLEKCKHCEVVHELINVFERFKQSAEDGNVNAQFAVGFCYYKGVGVDQDYCLAVDAFSKAWWDGCTNAIMLLGYMHEYGNGMNENKTKAFELYKEAADMGNIDAQYAMAWCYKRGIGIEKSINQMAFLFEEAAKQGHSSAAYYVGGCYYYGTGFEKDYIMAFEYYKQAALAGNCKGQHYAGDYYYHGTGTSINYEKAFEWFEKAVAEGDEEVEFMLEKCFTRLRCLNNDAWNIVFSYNEWHKNEQAAKQICHAIDLEHEIAFYLAKVAAAERCVKAYALLGDCYFSGRGTGTDLETAAEYYEEAEELSPASLSAESIMNLATCYANDAVFGKNEINEFAMLQRANTAFHDEINAIVAQMQ